MAAVRLLWVPLLLAPAGVVFVATRTTVDPIAGAERIDVLPHLPARVELPTAAIGITTPTRRVTVKVHARRPVQHKVAKPAKARIAHAPRPVYVVPKAVVAHVAPATAVTPHASQTPSPKPKAAPKPTPAATPALPPTTTPQPTPPEQPTPPVPPPEQPQQPPPTPVVLPAATPTPPAPTPNQPDGGNDDQGEDTDTKDSATRPGNGWGDRNHEHTGPPGHDGNHGHGHD